MQDFRMETFLTVCEYMNFTKAAQKLGLTQPAVSQHIHFLENEYQVRLFALNGRRIQLTEAGKLLQSAALSIKHDEIYLKSKMRRTEDKKKEYLFGATLTAAEYILPSRLVKFHKLHPESRISMHVGNTKELRQQIDSGELDFAVVEGYFPKEDYESFLFCNENYLPVCAGGMKETYGGENIRALLGQTLIVREDGSGTREVLEKILAEQGLAIQDFKNVLEIGNISVIKVLVSEGCGITFLYQAAVVEEIRTGRLRKIELADWNYSHNMMFIFRKGSIFMDDYRKIFEELSGSERDNT